MAFLLGGRSEPVNPLNTPTPVGLLAEYIISNTNYYYF